MPTGQPMTKRQMADAVAALLNEKNAKRAGFALDLTASAVAIRIDKTERRFGFMFQRSPQLTRRWEPTDRAVEFLNSNGYFQSTNGRWGRL